MSVWWWLNISTSPRPFMYWSRVCATSGQWKSSHFSVGQYSQLSNSDAHSWLITGKSRCHYYYGRQIAKTHSIFQVAGECRWIDSFHAQSLRRRCELLLNNCRSLSIRSLFANCGPCRLPLAIFIRSSYALTVRGIHPRQICLCTPLTPHQTPANIGHTT